MYNPSRCLHAVHNRTHTVSLTHNYVDGTNLPWVLEDAVRSYMPTTSAIMKDSTHTSID